MENNVRIVIESRQRAGAGDEELIRVEAIGTCRRVNGRRHVLYEETREENGDRTKNHLILEEGRAEVRRRGSTDSLLIYDPAETQEGYIGNAFGTIPLLIVTDSYLMEERREETRIRIKYCLKTGEETVLMCDMTMTIENKRQ